MNGVNNILLCESCGVRFIDQSLRRRIENTTRTTHSVLHDPLWSACLVMFEISATMMTSIPFGSETITLYKELKTKYSKLGVNKVYGAR